MVIPHFLQSYIFRVMSESMVSPTSVPLPSSGLESPTPNVELSPSLVPSGQETDNDGPGSANEKVAEKKKAASTTSAAPKRITSTASKIGGSLRSRTGPGPSTGTASGLDKPPTRPSAVRGSTTSTTGVGSKRPTIPKAVTDSSAVNKAVPVGKRQSMIGTGISGLRSPERKVSTERRVSTFNSGSTSTAPRRPPSSTSTSQPSGVPKVSRQGSVSTVSTSPTSVTPPSAASPVKGLVPPSKPSSATTSTTLSAAKRLSAIQGSPSTSSSVPTRSGTGTVASLKAKLQSVAGPSSGFSKDLPAREQVDSLKSRVAELEQRNQKLSDHNDALIKSNEQTSIAENRAGEDEVILLNAKIAELETIVSSLRSENENLKSVEHKLSNEQASVDTEHTNEDLQKLQATLDELHSKIAAMTVTHEAEILKLQQQLEEVCYSLLAIRIKSS